ncbi:hypothetical protein [Gulosibacter sp. ACHW.36C]|uniref:DUF1795 domain-containing protein n=1 Tax=Gulosibacter sediminis TaxID=1729695 RepID=A0ABY4MX59_9MICO|nr:hypothetical protein [Gulosibacter sediminis]UQN14369.1 hypothetical protein M3M28_09960 [Gulosibacter sediminis]
MAQVAATFEVPNGWEKFEWEGTLGGVRHLTATGDFHPNVLVTLDKWPGQVSAQQADEILGQQLTLAGAEVLERETFEEPRPGVEVATLQRDEAGATVRVRYRLQLLAAGANTLVLTAVATYLLEQADGVDADVTSILRSVDLTTSATRDA